MIPVSEMKIKKLERHLGIDLEESMKLPAEKLKFNFDGPPAPYHEYPKKKYHPTRGSMVVKSAIEEAELGAGWYSHRSEFPDSPTREFTTADKLELLEALGALIASEAEEGEALTDALYRIISERNTFAAMAAKSMDDPGKKSRKGA